VCVQPAMPCEEQAAFVLFNLIGLLFDDY